MVLGGSAATEARRLARSGASSGPPYAAIVYDVNAGRVLSATNADALRHPASITKVMTLYLLFEALERGKFTLDSELRTSIEASRQAPSKLGLRPGDTITVRDAILALITKSANDASMVVAEALAGDGDSFARQMTLKARALGMNRTVFRNPNGLPDPEQVTTARDLVILGQAIHDRFPKYYPLFATRAFNYEGDVYRNHNRLLGQVEGVDGIKTGYTRASGFNLLASARVGGRHLLVVVLGGRTARARDAVVASLFDEHMDTAVAGRRTPRTVDVASAARIEPRAEPARPRAVGLITRAAPADEEDEDAQENDRARDNARAPARAAPALPPASVPMPVVRPRPAVIAEVKLPPATIDQTARAGAPMAARQGIGSTGIRPGAAPLSLTATTPTSPQLRWAAGPQGRILPPGTVPYTNAATAEAPPTEERGQPLPDAARAFQPLDPPAEGGKAQTRLPQAPVLAADATSSTRPKVEVKAPEAPVPARTETVSESRPTPRAGWIIQLAAIDDETKARDILARAKTALPRVLTDAEPFTERVVKGESTLFRARFAGFDDREAKDACRQLIRTGFSCIAQKI